MNCVRLAVFLLALVLGACGRVAFSAPRPDSTPPVSAQEKPIETASEMRYEDFGFYENFSGRDIVQPTEAARMLLARDYDGIESLAARMEAEKRRDTDGTWQILHVPDMLGFLQGRDTLVWQNLIARLEEWNSARPASPTAKACLARALISYSWFFHEDNAGDSLQKAGTLLEEAIAANPDSMIPYRPLAALALVQGWPKDRREALFRNMKTRFPDDHTVYCDYAIYLSPQWHGSYEDLKKFEDEVISDLGDNLGSQMYTHIIWTVFNSDQGYLTNPDVSWPRMKKGFRELMKRWPNCRFHLNGFCRFACLNGDSVTARELMPAIGENFSWYVWQDTGHFMRYREVVMKGEWR